MCGNKQTRGNASEGNSSGGGEEGGAALSCAFIVKTLAVIKEM